MAKAKKSNPQADYTVPGLTMEKGHQVATELQMRLHSLNDLQLTLKHAHWNVVGPDFIGVHEMLDPQIDAVRAMVDETAERMATLGVSPVGTPGRLVAEREWDDYDIGLADTIAHLGALDVVYDGAISSMRDSIESIGPKDPITEDMLIGHTKQLELFQWFVRAHLQRASGKLTTSGASTETGAAKSASRGKSS